MSFTQAVSDGFSKYVTFSGRSSRSAYWWWTLFAFLLALVSYGLGLAIHSMVIYYLVVLVLFLPGLAVAVRRLHDIDRRGWWYLIGIIPIIGAIVLLIWTIQPSHGPNQFGSGPDEGAGTPTPLPST